MRRRRGDRSKATEHIEKQFELRNGGLRLRLFAALCQVVVMK